MKKNKKIKSIELNVKLNNFQKKIKDIVKDIGLKKITITNLKKTNEKH